MPFTLSHPAFAAPIRRLLPGKLALPGIVLGSMAPDLEYFVRMEAAGTIGHQTAGFVWIGMPLCIALCCAYLFIIRPALPSFMPVSGGLREYVHDRTCKRDAVTIGSWFFFLAAAFAGFGTHLFMDAWTHRSGWFVQHIEALRQPVMGEYAFRWLQYMTSVIGAGIIGGWLFKDWSRWRRVKPNGKRSEVRSHKESIIDYVWLVRWAGAGMIGLAVLLVKLNGMCSPYLLAVWVVAPFSAAAVGLYSVSLIVLTNRVRQWSFGLSMAVLLLATLWSLKLGIVSFAAIRSGLHLTPIERWIGTIWVFSGAIMLISVHTNRIVKEFVRIGLKTVNNRTLS